MIAGLIPALADALKVETSVTEIGHLAAEFRSLQDRFRRLALVTCYSDSVRAEAPLVEVMDRTDGARRASITPPEWCFFFAQMKIEKGHYDSQSIRRRNKRPTRNPLPRGPGFG